jgi:hypothetical protein
MSRIIPFFQDFSQEYAVYDTAQGFTNTAYAEPTTPIRITFGADGTFRVAWSFEISGTSTTGVYYVRIIDSNNTVYGEHIFSPRQTTSSNMESGFFNITTASPLTVRIEVMMTTGSGTGTIERVRLRSEMVS